MTERGEASGEGHTQTNTGEQGHRHTQGWRVLRQRHISVTAIMNWPREVYKYLTKSMQTIPFM